MSQTFSQHLDQRCITAARGSPGDISKKTRSGHPGLDCSSCWQVSHRNILEARFQWV